MTSQEEESSVLQVCLGTGQRLADLVGYSKDSIVSKIIMDKTAGTITLFAFDKGQKLSEHTAPYHAVVQILDGQARLTIDGRDRQVSAGDIMAVAGCGAYCLPLASNYNESLKPAIVLVKDGKARLIRRRETFEDLTRHDLV